MNPQSPRPVDVDQRSRSATAALGATRFGPVEWVMETGSTNDDLLASVRAGSAPGRVRVAEYQRAGRGRRDRRWVSAPGDALLMSVGMEFADADRAASFGTTIIAVSAADALHELGFDMVRIKWPNDLVVATASGHRKLAGVLAEAETAEPGGATAVVVGIGCNLWGARLESPDAIALSELGSPPEGEELLVAVLRRANGWLTQLDAGNEALLRARQRALSSTLGATVTVDTGNGRVEGTAVDLDESGALVLDTCDGLVTLTVGDVVSVRAL